MNGLSTSAVCAGQKCPERDDCLRYRQDGSRWVSLDIERQHFGDCQAKITATPGMLHRLTHQRPIVAAQVSRVSMPACPVA